MSMDTQTVIGLIRDTQAFLVGAVNNAVTVSYPDAVTEVYTFSTGTGLTLATSYVITVVYTGSAKTDISTATRTA